MSLVGYKREDGVLETYTTREMNVSRGAGCDQLTMSTQEKVELEMRDSLRRNREVKSNTYHNIKEYQGREKDRERDIFE